MANYFDSYPNSNLSPPSKRPLMPITTTNNAAAVTNGTTAKRSKLPPSRLAVPSGHVALRMLCHASLVGGFIGKSGASIKQLQVETGSKIRVEDSLGPGSDDRVIVIVAANTPFKRLRVGEGEEYEVSAAQEAAVRVWEKVVEVSEGVETTACRLMVEAVGAGAVIGKRGKVVEKMRRESGAKIRVLLGDHLPPGVSSPNEIVEIDGDVLAVKKALLGVCGCLQDCSEGEKLSIKERKTLESTSQPTAFDFRVDPPLQRTPVSVATSTSSTALMGRSMLFETDGMTTSDSKLQQQEVIFKILCLTDRIGGIIGRGGSIIKGLQDETGAAISIGPTISNCDERLITITSKEEVESRYSPAQRAVILVFSRSIETGVGKGLDSGLNKGSTVSARLVVPSNHAGCLLGKGGAIVSLMRKETRASISIIRGDQVPKCASEDDEVVEISGLFVNVQDALYQVTNRLRSNLFPGKVMNVPGSLFDTSVKLDSIRERVGDPTSIAFRQSSSASQYIDRQATARPGLDPPLLSHRLDNSPSPGLQTSGRAACVNLKSSVNLGRGLTSANESEIGRLADVRHSVNLGRGLTSVNGLELGSANRPAIITNTRVEILVPECAMSSVYGENGSNLTRIRQISGAKVFVDEAHPGSRDRTVIISGTPDETKAAQSLLHAFILTGP